MLASALPGQGRARRKKEHQVCATVRKEPPVTTGGSSYSDDPLGIPPCDTHLALQTDMAKELVNKIAWVLGSAYRVPYSNMRTPARQYAWRIVKKVLEDHGYPAKIAK